MSTTAPAMVAEPGVRFGLAHLLLVVALLVTGAAGLTTSLAFVVVPVLAARRRLLGRTARRLVRAPEPVARRAPVFCGTGKNHRRRLSSILPTLELYRDAKPFRYTATSAASRPFPQPASSDPPFRVPDAT